MVELLFKRKCIFRALFSLQLPCCPTQSDILLLQNDPIFNMQVHRKDMRICNNSFPYVFSLCIWHTTLISPARSITSEKHPCLPMYSIHLFMETNTDITLSWRNYSKMCVQNATNAYPWPASLERFRTLAPGVKKTVSAPPVHSHKYVSKPTNELCSEGNPATLPRSDRRKPVPNPFSPSFYDVLASSLLEALGWIHIRTISFALKMECIQPNPMNPELFSVDCVLPTPIPRSVHTSFDSITVDFRSKDVNNSRFKNRTTLLLQQKHLTTMIGTWPLSRIVQAIFLSCLTSTRA